MAYCKKLDNTPTKTPRKSFEAKRNITIDSQLITCIQCGKEINNSDNRIKLLKFDKKNNTFHKTDAIKKLETFLCTSLDRPKTTIVCKSCISVVGSSPFFNNGCKNVC